MKNALFFSKKFKIFSRGSDIEKHDIILRKYFNFNRELIKTINDVLISNVL